MTRRNDALRLALALALMLPLALLPAACTASASSPDGDSDKETAMAQEHDYEVVKSDEEWKEELTPEEYRVLRQKGTERPFTGDLLKNKEEGVYVCAACGQPLFDSETKFDSGTGWPSFYQPVDGDNVAEESDRSYGMVRTEVLCGRCGGHLGHVFPDGPKPTGLRYCINSVSLDFEPEGEEGGDGDGG